MPLYQNSSVADAKLEIGNYQIYVGAAGATAGAITVNLGAGMVKSFAYVPEMFTSQSGNSVDPIEGVARETATFDLDLIEYDGSSFSALSGGTMSGSSGSITVGGITAGTAMAGKGMKLVNTRRLSSGSLQTTTWVFNKCLLLNGWTMTPKSDNDADPISVYSFMVTAEQYATAGTIFTKTVA